MIEWARTHGKVSGRTAFECAKVGDKAAIEVKDKYIRYIAEGVSNIINIFQPDMFVIGGGISKEGDELLVPPKKLVFYSVVVMTTAALFLCSQCVEPLLLSGSAI